MTTIDAYRLLDHLQSDHDLARRLGLLGDADERLAAIQETGIACGPEEASEALGVLLSPQHLLPSDRPAGDSRDPRSEGWRLPAEDLAGRLLAFAGTAGGGSLLVRAGSVPVTCQRFSRDLLRGATHMCWEASSRDLRERPLGELSSAWIWRLHFTRSERGAAFHRRVLWPAAPGPARMLADLVLYVMQQAYGVDDDAVSFERVDW